MFLSRWTKQINTSLVGVDLGIQSIKLLKINDESPKLIENFLIAALPSESMTKGVITDFNAVGTILRDMFQTADVTSNHVAFAIPRSLAIFKNITLDSRLSGEDIEERVWMEADKHFPDLVGNIYLDFSISGKVKNESRQQEVMLVACRKDLIKPYLEICKVAGLIPKLVDISSYALERTLKAILAEKNGTETFSLLNLDLGLSTLVVRQGDSLLYSNDQSFDGIRLMEQVKNYLSNPQSDEEAVKKYDSILKEILSVHLRHTMHFFYSSCAHVHIDHVILSGDCAYLPGLKELVQQEVGIPTTIANPFENMELAERIDKKNLQENASALALCCGLALTQFDPEKGNKV